MSMYKSMRSAFIQEYKERSPQYKERIVKWSSEPPVVRIEGPTNIARARALGYKAKEGVIVARVHVLGGTKKRPANSGGRKPSKAGRFFTRRKSSQAIAEERANRKFTNFEVLNSYFVGAAGSDQFYEVILLEKANPVILSDPHYAPIVSQTNRAARGLTFEGRKHRGISRKGFGTIRFRPSKRANDRS
ncbi:MAG: 50S ribosomal protein L15e [Candidatus Micrarchaeales archaeon]|nr:50S ribosomal protein L15e [Candidatus Micrarchaeales archaeon]